MENEKNLNETQEEMIPAEETVPAVEEIAEETVSSEEVSPAEEVPAEEPKPEEKKVTPGKMALVIAAIVAVIAVIIALVMGGKAEAPAEPVETAPVETTEPVPTIPADGTVYLACYQDTEWKNGMMMLDKIGRYALRAE